MSSGIDGRIDGVQDLLSKLGSLGSLAEGAVKVALGEACLMVHNAAVKSIQACGSAGETYELYNPRRTHTASAPGEAPNSDLGTLARSVDISVDLDHLVGKVGTNLDYGLYLELGTTKMAARPWLYPAFEEHKAEIVKNLGEAIRIALRSRSA